MLEAKDIKFRYSKDKDARWIVNDITAEFEEGKFYSVFGPSGSGKTTLLAILGGLEKPLSGSISIDNLSLSEIGEDNVRRKYVSYIFQNYLLFPYMTAIENVVVSMDINDCVYGNKREQAVSLLLSLGFPEEDLKRKVSKLSGGQQQRVAIARSIVSPAKYILADEPTGNLDKETANNIIQTLEKIVRQHNKCLIVVTHSDLVRAASDISYRMDDGVLIKIT